MRIAFIALLAMCIPGAAAAEMRILSVDPSDPAPGDTIWIYGREFGPRPDGRVVQIYRVEDREPFFFLARILHWEDDRIRAQLPDALVSDAYGVRVHIPRTIIASNPVRITVRPRRFAREPDFEPIAANGCERQRQRRGSLGEDTERSTGALAPRCVNPLWRITTRNSVVEGGYRFYVNGDFGYPRPDLELALMEYRNGDYYLLRLLRAARWTPRVIEWDVPFGVRPGDYAFGLVYRVEGQLRTGPFFEHGSNIIGLRFER
jgi:hypothetical protein